MPKLCEPAHQTGDAVLSFLISTLPSASGLALLTFCMLFLLFSL